MSTGNLPPRENSDALRAISIPCSGVVPKPIPGSVIILSSGTPADSASRTSFSSMSFAYPMPSPGMKSVRNVPGLP